MTRQHVDRGDIVWFAQNRVNLPKDKAHVHRAQARRLLEELDECLSENLDFALGKMYLSDSLVKGAALLSINDIGLNCYISGADTPRYVGALFERLVGCLRNAFSNLSPHPVKPKTYSMLWG